MQGVAELVERKWLHVELHIGPLLRRIRPGESVQMRRRHRQRPPSQDGIFQTHQAPQYQGSVDRVHRRRVLNLENGPDLQVILQVLTHSEPVGDHLDTQ